MNGKNYNIPASYLVIKKNENILLLRRKNTGYEDGKYSFIAGHVEIGETFSKCIVREAKEEAGILIKENKIKVVHVMHRNSGMLENSQRVDVFFQTSEWEDTIKNMEPDKCDDLSWFNLNNLPENIIPYIREVIFSIKQGIYYSEYGWE